MPTPTTPEHPPTLCGDELCPKCRPPAEVGPEPGQLQTLLGVPGPPPPD